MQTAFNSSVFGKVALAVARTVRAETPGLSRSTRLADDLALSRLGRITLAMSLEDIFDVELENDVVERFFDIGDIVSHFSDRYFRDIEPSTPGIAA
jgi:acyl carrier protein